RRARIGKHGARRRCVTRVGSVGRADQEAVVGERDGGAKKVRVQTGRRVQACDLRPSAAERIVLVEVDSAWLFLGRVWIVPVVRGTYGRSLPVQRSIEAVIITRGQLSRRPDRAGALP